MGGDSSGRERTVVGNTRGAETQLLRPLQNGDQSMSTTTLTRDQVQAAATRVKWLQDRLATFKAILA